MRFCVSLAALMVTLLARADAAAYVVVLPSAPVDRNAQVVSFRLPDDIPPPAHLVDAAGNNLPLQGDDGQSASFFVAEQRAGDELNYLLVAGEVAAPPLSAEDNGDRVTLMDRGEPVLVFQKTPAPLPPGVTDRRYLRGAVIHPVFTPAGRVVTHNNPLNHPHHHGIWTSWAKTELQGRQPDFWNTHRANGATVEFERLVRTWSGPVDGGFISRQRFVDLTAPTPVAVLDEQWTVRGYNKVGNARLFDLEIVQKLIGRDPLVLRQHTYGGLGVRGSVQWEEPTRFRVLTSGDKTDRASANGLPARWVWLGGQVDGAQAGLAVLDHPSNVRSPQPVRVHPTMPYVSYAPVELGDLTISNEHPYSARYRILALDGEPSAAFIEACWQGFAHPAALRLEQREPPTTPAP